MITINPQAADVITIQLSDADQIQLNTTAIVLLDGGGSGGGDADTLDGQSGAYYLSRANHTGSQAISTVTGLQGALDAKLDIVDYNDRFLGLYASIMELETAHPTASAGDYAQVDWGIGTDVIVYVYDVDDAQWIPVGSSPIANTDALPEGSTNLYFTGQRVRDTPLTGLSTVTATPITAADSVLSAAGKLQAQISAALPVNKLYRQGQEYTQDMFSSNTSAATVTAGVISLIPVIVSESATIDQFTIVTAAASAGAQLKVAFYESVLSGASYSLTRIINEVLFDAAAANATLTASASATLLPNRLYFLALKTTVNRTLQTLPITNAVALGSVGGAKITQLTIASLFAEAFPATISTSGAGTSSAQPTAFRFRVASV